MAYYAETSAQEAIVADRLLAELKRPEQISLASDGENEPIVRETSSWWSSVPVIQMTIQTAYSHLSREIVPMVADQARFDLLVQQWKEDSQFLSLSAQMVLLPSYQEIIGMGPIAVPMILRQLISEGDDPDHWHWALRSITGEDPVPDGDLGDTRRMADAWVLWARMRFIF